MDLSDEPCMNMEDQHVPPSPSDKPTMKPPPSLKPIMFSQQDPDYLPAVPQHFLENDDWLGLNDPAQLYNMVDQALSQRNESGRGLLLVSSQSIKLVSQHSIGSFLRIQSDALRVQSQTLSLPHPLRFVPNTTLQPLAASPQDIFPQACFSQDPTIVHHNKSLQQVERSPVSTFIETPAIIHSEQPERERSIEFLKAHFPGHWQDPRTLMEHHTGTIPAARKKRKMSSDGTNVGAGNPIVGNEDEDEEFIKKKDGHRLATLAPETDDEGSEKDSEDDEYIDDLQDDPEVNSKRKNVRVSTLHKRAIPKRGRRATSSRKGHTITSETIQKRRKDDYERGTCICRSENCEECKRTCFYEYHRGHRTGEVCMRIFPFERLADLDRHKLSHAAIEWFWFDFLNILTLEEVPWYAAHQDATGFFCPNGEPVTSSNLQNTCVASFTRSDALRRHMTGSCRFKHNAGKSVTRPKRKKEQFQHPSVISHDENVAESTASLSDQIREASKKKAMELKPIVKRLLEDDAAGRRNGAEYRGLLKVFKKIRDGR